MRPNRAGALKVENGADAGVNKEVSPDVAVADEWATYTFDWTIPEGMTTIKFVPVAGIGAVVDFDNIGVLVRYVASRTITASASTGGSIDPSVRLSSIMAVPKPTRLQLMPIMISVMFSLTVDPSEVFFL